MSIRKSSWTALLVAAASLAARTAAADQVTLSQAPATLNAGATAQLQISVQLGTVPFGGYLFTLTYDTRTLTLLSIFQPSSGEFRDEFFRGPGDAQGSFTFQGLNDKSLIAPVGSAELAVAVFRATGSSVPFGASPSLTSAVSVTAREAVTTEASSVTLPGAAVDYQILGDTVAPTTTLVVSSGPQFSDGMGQLYGATTTLFGFMFADSAYGAFPPSGVTSTEYRVDASTPSAAFSPFAAPFALAEGSHVVEFRSVDGAGNAEPTQSRTVKVDATPPTSSIVYSTLPYVDASSRTFISASASIGFTALDPVSQGVASGVEAILFRVDAATATVPFQAFVSTFVLTGGIHGIDFHAVDNVANEEVVRSVQVDVDTVPPVTALLVNGLPESTTALALVSSDTLSLSVVDGGAGVRQTLITLDGDFETLYSASFTLTAGTHTIVFRSLDNVGNAEAAQSFFATVRSSDSTPPVLSLTPVDGSTVASAMPLVTALYSDSGSGIDVTSVHLTLDGADVTAQAAVTASSASFVPAFALTQGTHAVTAQVADLSGNQSSASSTFLVDSIAPVTTLLVNGLPAGTTDLVVITTDTLGFAASDAGAGVFQTLYALDGSTNEVVFASTFSVAVGTHTLAFRSVDAAGNAEAARTVFLTVLDEDRIAPELALAPVDGSTVTTAFPTIVAAYSDAGRGVDLASVRLTLDGVDVTTQAAVYASSAVLVPTTALSQATHSFTASVADLAGNAAAAASTFLVDSIAPVTTLLVDGLAAGSTSFVITSTNAISFSAIDAGTGVLETRYSVDGGTETVFASTFTLNPGAHSLAFHSRDVAGNLEAAQAVALDVRVPITDNVPPLLRLDYPGSAGLGVEQAVGGVVDVRGAVSDAANLTWTLEAAPGASATTGFTTIATGVDNVSGLLAAWDTSSLSGYFTLRLRAVDSFGNASSVTAVVFVGKPIFSFAIGRKDAHVIVNKLKNPTGIAVRSDGLIWVAGTDEDSLLLLTSSGAVVAEVDGDRDHGHGHGHGHGKAKGHDDDDEDMSFKNPQGLTLDAADNLFVADKGNNRVLKLSPDGSQVLLQLAKVDGQGRPKPGSGPGELRQPWDVAVDGNGDIYVADSGNARIQVFDSSGTYLRQFGQGVQLSTSEVRGIALTAEGLWVSDKEQERVFLFSRTGALIKSIGDADSAVGELSRMRGLASDRLGALYIAEPNRDRTQKFDPQGKGLLAFGSKAGLSKADKHAKRYLTQPIDAAIAPDGSIWITDTGRDRIVRYALPVSGGFGVAASGGETFSSDSVEPARRLVDHKDGARVERDDGAGVHVPEGALSADLEITVDKGDENQDKEDKTAKRQEKKVAAASEEVQYGPEGTTFNTPVTLVLPYDANLVASQGIKEDELKVYYWNPSLKDWQAMPSVVDKVNKTVSAQTTHFSGYQVQGPGGGIGVAAIDDFGLRDAYAFPNPSRSGAAVTFRIQPGLADSIEVRVYDLSGRKVHSSSDFRFLGAVDDGNGKGAQNTYDHVWGVSGVGSGVYTYVITAKRVGQSDIRKTGKVGVIK